MILVGQYDSPYVRRVAISLRVLGLGYQHDTRSVFGDFDSMRQTNPLGRIPSLILDEGEVLIDSNAILDWIDQSVGPARALVPPAGPERMRVLKLMALATGTLDKIGSANYERLIRPSQYRWPEWIERCLIQSKGALAALAAEKWPATDKLDQAQITTGCMLHYVRMTDPDSLPPGRYPTLDALHARLEARPEFQATSWSAYAVPRSA